MAKAGLRADARRNIEKLKAAAIEVFREKGLHAPLEEIAQRAGVSTGTLYNRFGSREALIDAVMPDLAQDALDQVVDKALACEDPWEGFAGYIEDVCRIQASDPALNDVISRRYAAEQLAVVSQVTEDRERQIIERAQQAGVLRADFTREDMLFAWWSTAPRFRGCLLWGQPAVALLQPHGLHPRIQPRPATHLTNASACVHQGAAGWQASCRADCHARDTLQPGAEKAAGTDNDRHPPTATPAGRGQTRGRLPPPRPHHPRPTAGRNESPTP